MVAWGILRRVSDRHSLGITDQQDVLSRGGKDSVYVASHGLSAWPGRALSFISLLVITSFLAITRADADLWGHLTFGRDIVAERWVHTIDPYSFTSDRPWINHEWLAEVLMWACYRLAGAAGLVALKMVMVCAVGWLVLETWRGRGLTPVRRDGLLFVTAIGVWPQFITIRPQVFSLVLFALELFAFERIRRRRRAWLLALVPIFMVWVNVHGGWLVGAGTLAVFVTCSMFDPVFKLRDRVLLCLVSVASAVATLGNPYGLRMLGFLFETVRPDRVDILEWRPVTQLPPVALALWTVPTMVAAAAVWRGRRTIPGFSLILSVLLAVASFRVARLVGLYALAVGLLLAPYVGSVSGVTEVNRPRPIRAWGAALAACLVLVGISTGLFGRRIPITPFPEPEVAAFVATNALRGRLLTFFDYGEYAIWHFWPSLQVSMDGRRETVYTERTIQRHLSLYRGEPDGPAYVSELRPDYVWLPRDAPGVAVLRASGWQPIFDGPVSIILAPKPEGFLPAPSGFHGTGFFPGP